MKTPSIDRRDLQRTRYWQGQKLRAADFRSQLNTEQQLRWWHNRAVHNAFGVTLGFEASRTPLKGPLETIHLEPGVAYDCFGRALILQTPREIPLPAVSAAATSFTLVARYRETGQFPDPRQTAGVCFSCCEASADLETPDFAWIATSTLRIEDGVPLGLLRRGFGAHSGTFFLDRSFIPAAPRPLARPTLANGSTIPGSTAWTFWSPGTGVLGFETIVDTSAAGFTRVPCYFATLDGLSIDFLGTEFQGAPLMAHIQDASANSFRFRLFLPGAAVLSREHNFNVPFFVRWLGCQSAGGADLCGAGAVEKPCCG
jgi:hypothetical protein